MESIDNVSLTNLLTMPYKSVVYIAYEKILKMILLYSVSNPELRKTVDTFEELKEKLNITVHMKNSLDS